MRKALFNFVDIDDPIAEENKKIRSRRLSTYGATALKVGASVENSYVMFLEFKAALTACDRIFELAKTLETPHGLLVTGPPGSSKTTLASYFLRSQPTSDLFETGFGAIMIRLRTSPTQGQIISGLLQALKYPFTQVKANRVFAMRDVAFEALKQRGTKVVFVDQAHCLSTQSRNKHTDVLESGASDTLREMMEETNVGLVLLADAAFRGLDHVDRALDDRITVKMELNHFTAGPDWDGFLKAFCTATTAIDLRIITDERIAAATLAATEGNRRSFRRLIVEATMVATQDGKTAVSEEHLRRAFAAVQGLASARNNPYGR